MVGSKSEHADNDTTECKRIHLCQKTPFGRKTLFICTNSATRSPPSALIWFSSKNQISAKCIPAIRLRLARIVRKPSYGTLSGQNRPILPSLADASRKWSSSWSDQRDDGLGDQTHSPVSKPKYRNLIKTGREVGHHAPSLFRPTNLRMYVHQACSCAVEKTIAAGRRDCFGSRSNHEKCASWRAHEGVS